MKTIEDAKAMIRFFRKHLRRPWYCINICINIRDDFTSEEAWFWRESSARSWCKEKGGSYGYVWPIEYPFAVPSSQVPPESEKED